MLIAEDLLLLLTDDRTGKATVDSQRLAFGLAGAVLVELVMAGRVQFVDGGGWGGGASVVVVNPQPTGDPLLDDGLARILGKRGQMRAQTFVTQLARGLSQVVRDRLVARGILRAERRRVLGIFPARSWPAADVRYEGHVRAALWDVVVVGRTPTDREVCLVALLNALGQAHKQLAGPGVSPRQVRERATALSAGNAAADAVRRAIQATEAAVMASITASTAVAASS